jgi:hypothetical protein
MTTTCPGSRLGARTHVVAALPKGGVGTFLQIGGEEPSGHPVELRGRSGALLRGQGFSTLGFADVALHRGKAHVEGAGRLGLGHPAFYGRDYLSSEVFGVTVHAAMLSSVHPRCNML